MNVLLVQDCMVRCECSCVPEMFVTLLASEIQSVPIWSVRLAQRGIMEPHIPVYWGIRCNIPVEGYSWSVQVHRRITYGTLKQK